MLSGKPHTDSGLFVIISQVQGQGPTVIHDRGGLRMLREAGARRAPACWGRLLRRGGRRGLPGRWRPAGAYAPWARPSLRSCSATAPLLPYGSSARSARGPPGAWQLVGHLQGSISIHHVSPTALRREQKSLLLGTNV